MLIPAVFIMSLSSLAFEVLLTRAFSISQWNHLSFMVISIALFGFAASGTFLGVLDTRKKGWERRLSTPGAVNLLLILYAVSASGSFTALNIIPLDYFRLPVEPLQTLYLFTAYLLLSIPFFFAGLITSIAYAAVPGKTGLVYFAAMTGSACGALLPIPLLEAAGEGKLVIAVSLLPLMLVFKGFLTRLRKTHFSHLVSITASALVLLAGVFFLIKGEDFINPAPSPYKTLGQLQKFPDFETIRRINGLRGRTDRVKSRFIRSAPGMSLKYAGNLPTQQAILKDGDTPFILYEHSGAPGFGREPFPRFSLPFCGYTLAGSPEKILVIAYSGGTCIPAALTSGAGDISVILPNPDMAGMVRSFYHIPVIADEPRGVLSKNRKKFDVIQIENFGASIPGAAALNQEYGFTAEAFKLYTDHLSDTGIIIISRRLLLPPSDTLRMWATSYESLKSSGFDNPHEHIAVLRNWDSFVLLISKQPFNLKNILTVTEALNFDIVYAPGAGRKLANRFNIYDAPYYFDETARLAAAYKTRTATDYFSSSLVSVSPQSDNRPFPEKFLKWKNLYKFYRSTGGRIYSMLMSGEIVIAVVFAEALIVSFFLLALPLAAIPAKEKKPPLHHTVYFLALGAGFMLAELFFIKKFVLITGDPVISFIISVSGILVFSGLGGYISGKIHYRGLLYCLPAIVVTFAIILLFIDSAISSILKFGAARRYFSALLIMLPPGVLMGIPFGLYMRCILNSPAQRAYAWAANGAASVLAAIAAAQVAVSFGINAIMKGAIFAYLIAVLCLKHQNRPFFYLNLKK